MTFQLVVEKREAMQLAIAAYRQELTADNLQIAQQTAAQYVDELVKFAKDNPSEDLSVYFSNPSVMTHAIIKDIQHILCGRAAQLPNILLLTDYGGLVYQKEPNVPYITNKIASDGRPIYECLVDMGGTATDKTVVLPAAVTSKWDTAGVYPPRVDLSGSYIRRSATVTFVIPYTHGHNTYVMSFATLNAHAGTLNTYCYYSGWLGFQHYALISYVLAPETQPE